MMSKRPGVLRRAVLSAAMAVAAVGALVTSAGPASAAPVQPSSVWVGPYYSQLQCELAVFLTLGDGTCWWNPNPPETTYGWWYEIS